MRSLPRNRRSSQRRKLLPVPLCCLLQALSAPAVCIAHQTGTHFLCRRAVSTAEDTKPEAPEPGADGDWVPVMPPEDLPKGVRKEVNVSDQSILLFWYRNQIYAISSRSPAEGAYSEGFIKAKFTQDYGIVCPATQSVFSLKDGSIMEWYPSNPVLRAVTPQSNPLPVRARSLRQLVHSLYEFHTWALCSQRCALSKARGLRTCNEVIITCACNVGTRLCQNAHCGSKLRLCGRINSSTRGCRVQIFPVKLTQDNIMVNVNSSASRIANMRGGADTSLENNNVFAVQPSVYTQGSDVDDGTGSAPQTLSTVLTFTVAIAAFAITATAGTATALYYEDYVLLGGFWLLLAMGGTYFGFQYVQNKKSE